MILSFQSGVINSIGFILFSVYLTHLTGIFSKIGLEAEQMHWSELLWWLTFPLTFVVGALLSTVWIEGQARNTQNPRYEWIFSLLALLMLSACSTALLTQIGARVMWLIAFCAGAQNAIFNERSGAIMRTTHFTGTTTDLGIGLARVLFKTLGNDAKRLAFENRLVFLRCISIVCFVLGSLMGSLLALRFHTLAFALPAGLYLLMAIDSTKVLKVLQAHK